jgi:hypothetical protein
LTPLHPSVPVTIHRQGYKRTVIVKAGHPVHPAVVVRVPWDVFAQGRTCRHCDQDKKKDMRYKTRKSIHLITFFHKVAAFGITFIFLSQ